MGDNIYRQNMALHRNSQSRIYIENGVYFITTNTYQEYPYFDEDLLCDVLVDNINISKLLKNFNLFAYKINPDHIHILMQPCGKYNYSKIMQSIKTNLGYDANWVMGCNNDVPKAGSREPAFHKHILRQKYRRQFIEKYGNHHDLAQFKWQDSFHDHVIRDKEDFFNHVEYIRNQWMKHNLPSNKYCFIDEELCKEMY